MFKAFLSAQTACKADSTPTHYLKMEGVLPQSEGRLVNKDRWNFRCWSHTSWTQARKCTQ